MRGEKVSLHMFENDQNVLNFISKSFDHEIPDILDRGEANDQDIMSIEKQIKDNRPTNYSFTG
jgi:hypothetical protein